MLKKGTHIICIPRSKVGHRNDVTPLPDECALWIGVITTEEKKYQKGRVYTRIRCVHQPRKGRNVACKVGREVDWWLGVVQVRAITKQDCVNMLCKKILTKTECAVIMAGLT